MFCSKALSGEYQDFSSVCWH